MKNIKLTFRNLIIIFLTLFSVNIISAQVGVNTSSPGATLDITGEPANAAVLDGVIAPRLTGVQLRAKTYTAAQTAAVIYVTAADEAPAGQTIGVTQVGYYFFNGTIWVALTAEEDDDFYEVGTTVAAQDIDDDIYRTGNMAIGKTSANSALDVQDNTSASAASISSTGSDNVLQVTRSGSKSNSSRGIYVNYSNGDTNTGSGIEQVAIGTYVRGGSGLSRRYGLYNNVGATVGNTRQVVGVYNKIRDGLGTKYGMWNNLTTTEDGTIYGVYTQTSDGTGFHEGIRNSLAGSEDSENTGSGNYISNTGDGEHKGVNNALTGTGTGRKIGNYTNITQSTGNNYGTYNDINNTTTGKSSYGSWNDINSSAGTNYAGWFDAYGTGSGVFYAAVFNRGHVIANESGGDNDFRIEGDTEENLVFVDASTDNVGIGTNTPSEKLEVNGKIKAVDINFSGIPSYNNTSQANSNLDVGDVWRINGEDILRIVQ